MSNLLTDFMISHTDVFLSHPIKAYDVDRQQTSQEHTDTHCLKARDHNTCDVLYFYSIITYSIIYKASADTQNRDRK